MPFITWIYNIAVMRHCAGLIFVMFFSIFLCGGCNSIDANYVLFERTKFEENPELRMSNIRPFSVDRGFTFAIRAHKRLNYSWKWMHPLPETLYLFSETPLAFDRVFSFDHNNILIREDDISCDFAHPKSGTLVWVNFQETDDPSIILGKISADNIEWPPIKVKYLKSWSEQLPIQVEILRIDPNDLLGQEKGPGAEVD